MATVKKIAEILTLSHLIKRMAGNLAIAVPIIAVSLLIGMFGYHHYENMTWVEAYENAAMILSGMGPVSEIVTDKGKIFAGTYALFSGVIFLVVIAVIIAPLFHRFLHKFLVKDTTK